MSYIFGAGVGPQGPDGPTGSQGPQGIQGLTGNTGPQGIAGSVGPSGSQGVAGPTGATGPVNVYRGTVTLGVLATSFAITHNLNLPSPYTAVVMIFLAGINIALTVFTGVTFTANAASFTMLSSALAAGTYTVLVMG